MIHGECKGDHEVAFVAKTGSSVLAVNRAHYNKLTRSLLDI